MERGGRTESERGIERETERAGKSERVCAQKRESKK